MSLAFENGKPIETPGILAQSPEWLHNEMTFNHVDLKSILGEFERHFNVAFEVNVIDNGQLFTGTIPGEDIDAALQVLSTIYHLKPTRVSKNKIILTALDAKK